MAPCCRHHVNMHSQVCLLGSGSIIGDMSVREGPDGPPRRSATVVALTELLTYKVPLKEFKRRMPADVLEVSDPLKALQYAGQQSEGKPEVPGHPVIPPGALQVQQHALYAAAGKVCVLTWMRHM